MSLFAPKSLGPGTREKLMDAHNEWLRGADDPTLKLLTEATNNLDDLRTPLESVKPSTVASDRLAASFKAALCRDAVTSFAMRGDILARGARGRNIELHMGALLSSLYTRET